MTVSLLAQVVFRLCVRPVAPLFFSLLMVWLVGFVLFFVGVLVLCTYLTFCLVVVCFCGLFMGFHPSLPSHLLCYVMLYGLTIETPILLAHIGPRP